jgi:hypothetical protein
MLLEKQIEAGVIKATPPPTKTYVPPKPSPPTPVTTPPIIPDTKPVVTPPIISDTKPVVTPPVDEGKKTYTIYNKEFPIQQSGQSQEAYNKDVIDYITKLYNIKIVNEPITGSSSDRFTVKYELPSGEIKTQSLAGRDFNTYIENLQKYQKANIIGVSSGERIFFSQPSSRQWSTYIDAATSMGKPVTTYTGETFDINKLNAKMEAEASRVTGAVQKLFYEVGTGKYVIGTKTATAGEIIGEYATPAGTMKLVDIGARDIVKFLGGFSGAIQYQIDYLGRGADISQIKSPEDALERGWQNLVGEAKAFQEAGEATVSALQRGDLIEAASRYLANPLITYGITELWGYGFTTLGATKFGYTPIIGGETVAEAKTILPTITRARVIEVGAGTAMFAPQVVQAGFEGRLSETFGAMAFQTPFMIGGYEAGREWALSTRPTELRIGLQTELGALRREVGQTIGDIGAGAKFEATKAMYSTIGAENVARMAEFGQKVSIASEFEFGKMRYGAEQTIISASDLGIDVSVVAGFERAKLGAITRETAAPVVEVGRFFAKDLIPGIKETPTYIGAKTIGMEIKYETGRAIEAVKKTGAYVDLTTAGKFELDRLGAFAKQDVLEAKGLGIDISTKAEFELSKLGYMTKGDIEDFGIGKMGYVEHGKEAYISLRGEVPKQRISAIEEIEMRGLSDITIEEMTPSEYYESIRTKDYYKPSKGVEVKKVAIKGVTIEEWSPQAKIKKPMLEEVTTPELKLIEATPETPWYLERVPESAKGYTFYQYQYGRFLKTKLIYSAQEGIGLLPEQRMTAKFIRPWEKIGIMQREIVKAAGAKGLSLAGKMEYGTIEGAGLPRVPIEEMDILKAIGLSERGKPLVPTERQLLIEETARAGRLKALGYEESVKTLFEKDVLENIIGLEKEGLLVTTERQLLAEELARTGRIKALQGKEQIETGLNKLTIEDYFGRLGKKEAEGMIRVKRKSMIYKDVKETGLIAEPKTEKVSVSEEGTITRLEEPKAKEVSVSEEGTIIELKAPETAKETVTRTYEPSSITEYEWYQEPILEIDWETPIKTTGKRQGGLYAQAYGYIPAEIAGTSVAIHKHWKDVAPGLKKETKEGLAYGIDTDVGLISGIGELSVGVKRTGVDVGTKIDTGVKEKVEVGTKVDVASLVGSKLRLDLLTALKTDLLFKPTYVETPGYEPEKFKDRYIEDDYTGKGGGGGGGLFRDGEEEPGKRKKPKKMIREEKQPAYNVYVKDKEILGRPMKYERLNPVPVTRREAMNLLGTTLDETRASTGYIRRTFGRPQPSGLQLKEFESIGHKFKKQGNRLTEKKQYLSDTPGEKTGLSAAEWVRGRRANPSLNLTGEKKKNERYY